MLAHTARALHMDAETLASLTAVYDAAIQSRDHLRQQKAAITGLNRANTLAIDSAFILELDDALDNANFNVTAAHFYLQRHLLKVQLKNRASDFLHAEILSLLEAVDVEGKEKIDTRQHRILISGQTRQLSPSACRNVNLEINRMTRAIEALRDLHQHAMRDNINVPELNACLERVEIISTELSPQPSSRLKNIGWGLQVIGLAVLAMGLLTFIGAAMGFMVVAAMPTVLFFIIQVGSLTAMFSGGGMAFFGKALYEEGSAPLVTKFNIFTEAARSALTEPLGRGVLFTEAKLRPTLSAAQRL